MIWMSLNFLKKAIRIRIRKENTNLNDWYSWLTDLNLKNYIGLFFLPICQICTNWKKYFKTKTDKSLSISQERLNDLAMLSIEKVITKIIDFEM